MWMLETNSPSDLSFNFWSLRTNVLRNTTCVMKSSSFSFWGMQGGGGGGLSTNLAFLAAGI